MPNMLEVIRELKFLQGKQAAGTASPAENARIAELQSFMTGQKRPDPAPAGPPVQKPAYQGSGESPGGARTREQGPAPAAKPAAPAAAAAPAPRPATPAPKPFSEPEPDSGAFSLSLDGDLAKEIGGFSPEDDPDAGSRLAATTHSAGDIDESDNPFALNLEAAGLQEEPDESDAAKTTFEVEGEVEAQGAAGADNPFALAVPEGLDELGFEDNQGGVTHELDDADLGPAEEGEGPHGLKLGTDFEKALEKADGSTVNAAPKAPAGQPLVPDAHYIPLKANDNSVVVYFRDGKIGNGVASAFTPMAQTFALNQLLPAKPPIPVKLDECLTVRFVRAYNDPTHCVAPFAKTGGPVAAQGGGQRVQVKMLDGETIVGTAMPHKPGESFFLIPAVNTGNIRRIWISAKAVRSMTALT